MPISSPNYTQFPDELLDVWMARLSDPEWRVLCYIVRHTFGWKKEVDQISYQQFLHGVARRNGPNTDYGCGLRSRPALSAALRGLVEKKLIRRVASRGAHGVVAVTAYEVWVEEEQPEPDQELARRAGAQTQLGATQVPSTPIPLSSRNELSGKRAAQGSRNELSGTRGGVHQMNSGWVHEMNPQKITTLQKTNKQKTTICAASAAPAPPSRKEHAMADAIVESAAQATPGAYAKSNGRQRKMTDEEKAQVEQALDRFNDRLRPIVDDEYGRFIREALSGIRGFGLEHYLSTINLMATAERFVGDPAVTPLTVTKTVPIWEDNGKPRTWRELQERKKRRMQNGRH